MSLKRDSLNLSAINGVRIFLGFSFHILLGRAFGISGKLDSLFVALTIFTFAGMAHLFLTSLFIPTFNEIAQRDKQDAFVFADVVMKWSTAIVCIIVFFVLLSGDLIVKAVASGFDPNRIALTRKITQIILISLIFHTFSITVTYTLNALHYFSIPAATGLLHPLFNIASLYTLVPNYGIKAIAMAYLASNFLQACILLSYLRMNTRWRLTSKIYHDQLPALFSKSSKMAATAIIWDLREIVSRNIASHLPSGSVAIFAYAEKIIMILFHLAISPISKVFYSRVSEWISANQWKDVRESLRKIIRANLILVFFIASTTVLFLKPTFNMFFNKSRFTGHDISMLYNLVLIMLVTLIVLSYKDHLARIAYATKSIKTVAYGSFLGLIVFSITAFFLSKIYQVYGLAMAMSITYISVSLVYLYFINKLLSTNLAIILLDIISPFLISLLFTLIGFILKNIVANTTFTIFLMIPTWSLLYLLLIKWFVVGKQPRSVGFKKIFSGG
jgi:putative peptidoglycan lipid II flippase